MVNTHEKMLMLPVNKGNLNNNTIKVPFNPSENGLHTVKYQ